MYFNFLLLNAIIKQREAAPLLDGVQIDKTSSSTAHYVTLCNSSVSKSFSYSLLKESQKLNAMIEDYEMKQKEYALQNTMNENSIAKDESLSGMKFTPSNCIKEMKIDDSFNLPLFEEITDLRNKIGRKIDSSYFKNDGDLSLELLSFYHSLDYSTSVKARVYDSFNSRTTLHPVDKNMIFAINIVYNLGRANRLRHYRKLLLKNDNCGINFANEYSQDLDNTEDSQDLDNDEDSQESLDSEDDKGFVKRKVIGFFKKNSSCKLDKDFVRLFNKMPVLKAAILMCSYKNKRVVIKQNKFQIEHFKTTGKDASYLLVEEKSNKKNIVLTDMLGYFEKPTILRIRLPAKNIIEYFNFIRNILCLFDTIDIIKTFFYDSKTASKNNFGENIDNKTQDCLSLIVNDLLGKELVSYRPKIRGFAIIGYDTINNTTLDALAKIPLEIFFLLGTNSKLDCIYTLSLFEPQCALKNSIREFGGIVSAAGILYSHIGGEQLKALHIFRQMQFKTINDDMIIKDPYYRHLPTYFEKGNLLSLPKVCRKGPNGEAPAMKFVVDNMRFYPPNDTWFSPAGYNTSYESKLQIKEKIVTEKELEEMVVYRIGQDASIFDFEDKKVVTLEIYDTWEESRRVIYAAVRQTKDVNYLVIKCTRPLNYLGTLFCCKPTKAFIQFFISVFKIWIEESENKNHMLTFEVIEDENNTCSLRDAFINIYKEDRNVDIDKKQLARVTFKKLIEKETSAE
ncbi:hypothetical protein ENBRE01_3165 [Enteropsectra breve]|nr:hypothetical protein ENBRE01_3165 [Enteropsectra breve]